MDISYITLHVLKETCQTYIIVFSRYCVSMFGMWYYYYRITFFFLTNVESLVLSFFVDLLVCVDGNHGRRKKVIVVVWVITSLVFVMILTFCIYMTKQRY